MLAGRRSRSRAVNQKRVERLYREEALSCRWRRRKRLSRLRVPCERPVATNQTWVVGFVHDRLLTDAGSGCSRCYMLYRWNRERVAIEVDFSLTGERVTRVLEELRTEHGLPLVIQGDNGPELRGRKLDQRAYEHGVPPQFIKTGKPIQNPHIESFNARLREECLNEHLFLPFAQRCARQDRAATPPLQSGMPASKLGQSNP
jgi:putative transposase